MAAYSQPSREQIIAAKMKQVLNMGVGCGMFIGIPLVIYCLSTTLSSLINSSTEKLCLVQPQQQRPVVYGDQIPIGMSNSINWQVNFISAMGAAFFFCLVKVAFIKSKNPIFAGGLGVSVLLLGFDLCVYLPWCALFSEAHSYQVCAGEYLPQEFGNDYMYDEDF